MQGDSPWPLVFPSEAVTFPYICPSPLHLSLHLSLQAVHLHPRPQQGQGECSMVLPRQPGVWLSLCSCHMARAATESTGGREILCLQPPTEQGPRSPPAPPTEHSPNTTIHLPPAEPGTPAAPALHTQKLDQGSSWPQKPSPTSASG